MFPYDPPGPPPATWKEGSGVGLFYEVGNIANVVAAGHAESMCYILQLGIDNIRAYNRPPTEKAVEGDSEARLSDPHSAGQRYADSILRRPESGRTAGEAQEGECGAEGGVEPDARLMFGL